MNCNLFWWGYLKVLVLERIETPSISLRAHGSNRFICHVFLSISLFLSLFYPAIGLHH